MIQSAHLKSTLEHGVPVAVITTEKVGEYETHALEVDLTALAAQCRHRVAVDMSQVKLLSSVGIGLMLKLNKTMSANKGKIVFFALDPTIMKLIVMTRLDKGLAITKDKDSAVKALQ